VALTQPVKRGAGQLTGDEAVGQSPRILAEPVRAVPT
jgi:hypothetical protein